LRRGVVPVIMRKCTIMKVDKLISPAGLTQV